jgi:hypothetical protein
MTAKEKLYKQYLEIKNEYYTLNNEPEKVIELTDEFLNSYAFKGTAAKQKKEEWEHDINVEKSNLFYLKKQLLILDYYKTDEGKAYEAGIKAEIDGVLAEIDRTEKEIRSYIAGIISTYLGTGWEVGHVGNRQTVIRYVKGYDNEGLPLVKRRYDFSIYYDIHHEENSLFQMNYPTLGSWDLFNDEDMRTYLAGVGKFGTDKKVIKTIFDALEKYAKESDELLHKKYKLTNKLKNPDALKDIEEE